MSSNTEDSHLFETISFCAIYFVLSFVEKSKHMQALLTKTFDKKQSKYVYNLTNIYYLPLTIIRQITFIIFTYILAVMFWFYVMRSQRTWLFTKSIYIVSVGLYASIIMFLIYFYIEKYSKLSSTWNSYRHESANNRNFTFILIFNWIFITIIFHSIISIKSLGPYFLMEITTKKQTNTPKPFLTLILGIGIFTFLNIMYPYKKDPAKTPVKQISHTIAFLTALMFC